MGPLLLWAERSPVVAQPSLAELGAALADPAVAPFASRAGYSGADLGQVEASHAPSGDVPVAVTFARPLNGTAYADALSFFQREGLTVTLTTTDRLLVGLDGPATVVAKAFSTTLVAGTYNGSRVLLPESPPSLPSSLQEEIAGVVGLSSGFTTFSFELRPAVTPPDAAANPAGITELTPALARAFYGFSSLYNLSGGANNTTYPANASIAVVLWGSGYAPNDINMFLSQYYPSPPFPVPSIIDDPVAGAPTPANTAPDGADASAVEELTLDIEWAISMAPGATIDAVYAPSSQAPPYSPSAVNLTEALATAVSLDTNVISMSFGTTESTDASLKSSWQPLLQQATDDGTTVLAATGDTGGDTNDKPVCSGTPAPEYPASWPSVIAVGGTTLTSVTTPLGGTTYSESAWNDSGGGFSTQFAAPSWQEVGTANQTISANGHRWIPDVSAAAADDLLVFNGSTMAAGGTSFATPIWAGLVADLDAKWGHSLGFFTPRLYHVGASEPSGAIGLGLVAVTGGRNCIGSASSGWNVVTGWGSPRAAVLYDDLLGSFVNIALYVGQTVVPPGGSVSVTAQLTNRTSGAPIAGAPVDLSISSDTDLGPCTGTFQAASPVTNATGWVSARLSVPFCYLGGHALLNASVTTTKLYGMNGLRLDVNLLGLWPLLSFLTQPPWAYVAYSVIVGAAVVAGAWIGRPKEPAPAVRPPQGAMGLPSQPPKAPPSAPSSGAPPAPSPPPEAPPAPAPSGPPQPSPPTPPSSAG